MTTTADMLFQADTIETDVTHIFDLPGAFQISLCGRPNTHGRGVSLSDMPLPVCGTCRRALGSVIDDLNASLLRSAHSIVEMPTDPGAASPS